MKTDKSTEKALAKESKHLHKIKARLAKLDRQIKRAEKIKGASVHALPPFMETLRTR